MTRAEIKNLSAGSVVWLVTCTVGHSGRLTAHVTEAVVVRVVSTGVMLELPTGPLNVWCRRVWLTKEEAVRKLREALTSLLIDTQDTLKELSK